MLIEQPQSGSWLKPADLVGHLLLVIRVHKFDIRFDQKAGADKEFAQFDVVDLDGAQTVETVFDSHPVIISKIRNLKPGSVILGRIGQVPTGKASPAWGLIEYTPGVDDVRAQMWLDTHPQNLTGQSAPQAPPASQPAYRYPQGAAPPMTGVGTPAAAAPAPPPPASAPEADSPEVAALKAQLAAAQNQ